MVDIDSSTASTVASRDGAVVRLPSHGKASQFVKAPGSLVPSMTVVVPPDLDGVLHALREHPDAHLLAGGTDLMVEVNYGHRRPPAVIGLRRCRELAEHGPSDDGGYVIGAGVTYAALESSDIARRYPALAAAARTVGSPQIRNAGTIGGNVGTGSPAGDTLPVLVALDARIEMKSVDGGTRILPWHEFFLTPKRTARTSGEVITAIHLPPVDGPQDYLKVGTRNAMVISVASLALVIDSLTRTIRVGLGSVGPVPLRAPEAEAWAANHIAWDTLRVPDPRTYETFGAMVADASRPIDDHRSTAQYRRHAVGVMAQRALMRLVP
jgi:CO/xanthine dehydrogenase FAD-binding subunit